MSSDKVFSSDESFGSAVAVVGLACRMPGADSPEELWPRLRSGEDTISRFSEEELVAAGVPLDQIRSSTFVGAKGVVKDADCFDAACFDLSPREAALTDPQQRLFLECAWSGLEDAGYDAGRYPDSIGVFAGSILSMYLLQNLWSNPEVTAAAGHFQTAVGNDPTFLATSASYRLDLRGPSVTVGTACSTSLVAVHLACQSLLNQECDMALAGGASVHLPLIAGYRYEKGGILSPDGYCRPFDARAEGTVSSDGAGVVVLKRLADAMADGDTIRAVIRGSAINNDGRAKVGYTAPSVTGEARAIGEALAVAEVDPESLAFIETHGAGTLLGDPIEIEALRQAFGEVAAGEKCALGSIKANLGHLDAAAGIAGLIKAVLTLEHREIPPLPHFSSPNPDLKLDESPFYVNTELRPISADQIARGGVSSFGIGGTNAHVVLEEAPVASSAMPAERSHELLVLSARSAAALDTACERLAGFLEESPDAPFADVCFTLRQGRRQWEHRRALVSADGGEAIELLRQGHARKSASGVVEGLPRSVAFMMPGLGDHYPMMGWQLYCEQSTFRAVIDHCAEHLKSFLGSDLRDFLYPDLDWSNPRWRLEDRPVASDGVDLAALLGRVKKKAPEQKIPEPPTAVAQPMIFVTELALAQLLLSWGIEPRAMIGHSIGELAAACCAGVFELPEALELVAERAGLIQERVGPGAMLAVPLTEADLRPLLPDGADLGAVNGSALCVASGEIPAIERLEALLKERKVQCRRLSTSHAFHSRMMEAILEPLAEVVGGLSLSPPSIPLISCVTGRRLTDEEATDPSYWVHQVCRTVRFSTGVEYLFEDPDRILLEVGPGQGLTSRALGERGKDSQRRNPVIPTLPWSYDPRPEAEVLLKAMADLWVSGMELGPGFLDRRGARRLPLPTYPFERKRHWIEPGSPPSGADGPARVTGKSSDLSQWFYLPAWKPTPTPMPSDPQAPENWLLLADPRPAPGSWLGTLADKLEGRVLWVEPGEKNLFADDRITVAPGSPDGFDRLMGFLAEKGFRPSRVIHAWSLTTGLSSPGLPSSGRAFSEAQDRGFGALMSLLKSSSSQEGGLGSLRLDILTDQMFDVGVGEEIAPEKATLEAVCLVAPQEHPGLICRCIDVGRADGIPDAERLVQIKRELQGPGREAAVAYRRGRRWVRSYEPVELASASALPLQGASIRRQGVYLITGGLGGVGLILARFLAERYAARLVLLGRTQLPDRSSWPQISADPDANESIRAKIEAIQELEAMGAKVSTPAADVAEEGALEKVVEGVYRDFGELHGVIHGAGLPGVDAFREIVQASPADALAQFRAKVHGTLSLDRALGGRGLDFCVLMSSLSAVLGGLGFAGYGASNLFLDAYAARKNREGSPTPWISINWESWRQPSAAEPVIPGLGATVNELTMEPDEGADALERILAQPRLGQVVVSCGDLQARLTQWTRQGRKPTAESVGTIYERPELSNDFVAPRNELERQLADIWCELFGLSEVGVEDNFFDLGGHSLLATQLNARIFSVLQVEMSLATLLQTPTIIELAAAVEERQFEQSDPAELEALLAEIGALSAEEAQQLLAEDPVD